MLANLAAHLFASEAIVTTEAKAKALRPYAEQLDHEGEEGRRAPAAPGRRRTIQDKEAAHKLFAEIGPRYEDRNGGYTADPQARPAPGDSAPMARIELV